MIDVAEIKPAEPAELRKFAYIVSTGLIFLFSLLPALLKHHFHAWPIAAGLALGGLGFLAPRSLSRVHYAWMLLGSTLGWFNSRVILTVIFYTMIAPCGIMMRIFRRPTLVAFRKLDPGRVSYRTPCLARPSEHMEKTF